MKKASTIILAVIIIFLIAFIGYQTKKTNSIWQVTQYSSITGNQSMFYTLTSKDGKLIIIDGGWKEDEEQVRQIAKQYNNKIEV